MNWQETSVLCSNITENNCDSADFPWCFYSVEHLVDFLYMILPGYLADVISRFTYHLPQLVIAAAIIFTGIYILTRKKDALDEEQPESFTEEEHYWTPYRPYQQNVPNMETDAVKNTTDQ